MLVTFSGPSPKSTGTDSSKGLEVKQSWPEEHLRLSRDLLELREERRVYGRLGDMGEDSVPKVGRKLVQPKLVWGSSRPALRRTVKGTFTNMFIAKEELQTALGHRRTSRSPQKQPCGQSRDI